MSYSSWLDNKSSAWIYWLYPLAPPLLLGSKPCELFSFIKSYILSPTGCWTVPSEPPVNAPANAPLFEALKNAGNDADKFPSLIFPFSSR